MIADIKRELQSEMGLLPLALLRDRRTSFVELYLMPVLYPASLTRGWQWLLGGVVVGVNAAVYVYAWRRSKALHRPRP